MIRVMVVDDEPLALEELSRLIELNADFKVVQTASNGRDALEKLKKNPVALVFLDIDMPVLNGLETASRLSEWENPPIVVFATAYDQHALEAFDRNAVDYLLKPYDPVRLEKALSRVEKLLMDKTPTQEPLKALDQDLIARGLVKKIIGHKRNSKERVVLDPKDIFYFNVEYSEIRAFTPSGEVIVNHTLKNLQEQLEADFLQTHKSYLVNIHQILRMIPLFSGNFELVLKDAAGTKVPLSRRYAKALKTRLGSW